MIKRGITVALGVLCVILITCLGVVIAYYATVIKYKNSSYASLNAEYQNYQSNHSHSNSDYDSLNVDDQNYRSSHSYSNSDIDPLLAPLLIQVDLTGYWYKASFYYFVVTGYLVNVHNNSAYNSQIFVVAYNINGELVVNDSRNLGTIVGQSSYQVFESFPYGDSTGEISNYAITPEWTDTP